MDYLLTNSRYAGDSRKFGSTQNFVLPFYLCVDFPLSRAGLGSATPVKGLRSTLEEVSRHAHNHGLNQT